MKRFTLKEIFGFIFLVAATLWLYDWTIGFNSGFLGDFWVGLNWQLENRRPSGGEFTGSVVGGVVRIFIAIIIGFGFYRVLSGKWPS